MPVYWHTVQQYVSLLLGQVCYCSGNLAAVTTKVKPTQNYIPEYTAIAIITWSR
jgi:hypothetical protein